MLNLIKGKEDRQHDDWNRGWEDGSEMVHQKVDGTVQKAVNALVDNERASDFYKGGYLSGVADELLRTAYAVAVMSMKGDVLSASACISSMVGRIMKEQVMINATEESDGE